MDKSQLFMVKPAAPAVERGNCRAWWVQGLEREVRGPGDGLCPGIRAKRVRSAWMLTDGVLKVEPTAFIDTLDEGWGESESREPGGQGTTY